MESIIQNSIVVLLALAALVLLRMYYSAAKRIKAAKERIADARAYYKRQAAEVESGMLLLNKIGQSESKEMETQRAFLKYFTSKLEAVETIII